MIIDQLRRNKLISTFFIYLFIPLIPLLAFEYEDFLVIDLLVESCYQDKESCKDALFNINKYQRHAAKNNNFSCQTRLLGLEANLIMAMNSNIKRKGAKSIIQTVKKYC